MNEPPPIASTIRRIAGGARLIGLGWMLVLVLVALARDALAQPEVGWALAGVTATWAILAGLDQMRTRASDALWVTIGDTALASFALLAPELAGSEDLFYGGFPGIAVVAAAARQRKLGWIVAAILSIVTMIRFQIADFAQVLEQLSALVTYSMLAAIVGWAVHVIYRTDEARRQAEDEKTRAEEKSALASRLHDSVLQTLALIQREPGDRDRVARLARRQEQELRGWLFGSPNLARSLELAAAELEENYGARIEVVTAGDAPIGRPGQAILDAGREAMLNALKHSGSDRIDAYLEVANGRIKLFVRDRGVGFDSQEVNPDRVGLRESVAKRIEAVGGTVVVNSKLGVGTELRLEVPL